MDINNILAMPLKLPKFEPDDWDLFWEVWNRDKRDYNRNYPDSAGNNSPHGPSWTGMNWKFNQTEPVTMFDILTKDYSNVFPKLHKLLVDTFPFEIQHILFQSNIRTITPHKDGNPLSDHLSYPASARIMLTDENANPTFFFVRNDRTEYKFLELPEDTNSFVFNNPKILHGATFHKKEKILMQIVGKNFDEPRWFKILEESYDTYKDIFSIVE